MVNTAQNTIPRRPGIYEIRNCVDGKRYIGSAMSLRKRWRDHTDALMGKHGRANPRLKNAWRKYGPSAFTFKPIIYCAPEHLLLYEQLVLDGLRPEYNIRKIAESNIGVKWSDETKAKMGAPKRGRKRGPITEELRAVLSAMKKGKPLSAEHRAKISEVQRGQKRGPRPSWIAAKAAAANRGFERTPEYRKRVSEAKGGLTDEQVREIRRRLSGGESNKSVSDSSGVDPSTVSNIKRGKRYAWVTASA